MEVLGGVIDPDYRGNVAVLLINHGNKEFVLKRGDRFAQMIFEKADLGEVVEIPVSDLETTHRGGFGSTGR